MNPLIKFLLFSLTLISIHVSGQSFKNQFTELVSKNDTIEQQKLLEKWERAEKNDPELFVAYFNYYVIKSKKEIITMGQNPGGKEALQIMNPDTTKKEPIAFMYGDNYYDPLELSKAFGWINKGIEQHPDRLDMRFGKTYILGELEDYENFTNEIIKTIEYSSINKNKWNWAESKAVDSPKEFMLNSIQSYQLKLYNTENDKLLVNMKRIAETVLKNYPDHIESLSNLSIVYMLQNQYDKALDPLLKAEKLSPKDFIVLSNIAQAYKLKGDNKNAIKYYELTIKYGDNQAKQQAQNQIDKLKKK